MKTMVDSTISAETAAGKDGSAAEAPVLKRTLGISDAVLVILSSVIGIGIFLTPTVIARQINSPHWFLMMWFFGGLIALSGAMSSASLGVMMPRAGGDYVFLRSAYGESWGFMYGYLSFVLSFTGSIATLAVGIVHYQGRTIVEGLPRVFPGFFAWSNIDPNSLTGFLQTPLISIQSLSYSFQLEHLIAIVLVLGFTWINHFGTRKSLNIQRVITMAPIFLLVAAGGVIVYKTMFGIEGADAVLTKNFEGRSFLADIPGPEIMAMALIPVFFTYCGWNAALYLGEDIKTPRKSIPQSLLIGVAIITVIYFLFCTVVLSTIPYEELHNQNASPDIASRAWGVLFGTEAQVIMAVVIAVLILGSLNSSIITGSRIYFAMARDGIFMSRAGKIHPRFGTPSVSLWSQAIWACLIIVFVGKFKTILEFTTIIIIFMSIMTVSSIFVVQKRMRARSAEEGNGKKSKEDSGHLFGYPYMPIFYIGSTLLVLIGYLWPTKDAKTGVLKTDNLEKGLIGLGIVLIGFVVYFVWRRGNDFVRNRRSTENGSNRPGE